MKRSFWVVCAAILTLFCAGIVGAVLDNQSAVVARASAPPPGVSVPVQCDPAPGAGHIGVCTTQPANRLLRATRPVGVVAPHGLIYDLYEGDWRGCSAPLAQARGHLVGVIVKAYEYRSDFCFAHYWRLLAKAHIWHAAYVFAHGCWQARAFVGTVKAAGGWDAYAGPNVVDAEVPDAFGSVACLSPQIRALSRVTTVVGYTAPGTWPGGGDGGDPLWIATYGLSFGCVWTCHPVAWQYTDGSYGPFPHAVGPFHGDLSINYGLTQILAHPIQQPPNPVCYHHRPPRAQCSAVRARVAKWRRAEAPIQRGLVAVRHSLASHRCIRPYRRAVCVNSGRIDRVLTRRWDWYWTQIRTTIAEY